MIHTLTCPVCDFQVERAQGETPRSALLTHVWKHLRYMDHSESGKSNSRPSECRVCWCGRNYFGYVFWLEHMKSLDVQAHYLACQLNIGSER